MDCEIKSFHTLLDLQAEEEGFMTARQTTNRGHVEMRTHRKWKFECHGRLNVSIISSKVQVHKQSIWLICLNEISADLLLCLSLLYMQVWLKTQWFYTELSQFPKAFRGVMTVNSSSFGAYLPYPCHLSPLISCGSRSNQNVADGLTGSYEIIIHFLSIQKKQSYSPRKCIFNVYFLFFSLLGGCQTISKQDWRYHKKPQHKFNHEDSLTVHSFTNQIVPPWIYWTNKLLPANFKPFIRCFIVASSDSPSAWLPCGISLTIYGDD